MILWRVSDFTSLSGEGGLHVSGRWHTAGTPIIYSAESVALALLESLVQFDDDRIELPPDYQLLKLQASDSDPLEWHGDLPPYEESQRWGDAWLREGRSLLARVPAAVAPFSWNWLINPGHPEAAQLQVLDAARGTGMRGCCANR